MEKTIYKDWLQINCSGYKGSLRAEGWELKPIQTQIFRDVYEYKEDEKIYFTAVCSPKSPVLAADMIIIKFENWFLYEKDHIKVFKSLIDFEGLYYNNITRLDICFDFNIFDNGLKPKYLIRDFLSNKYLKNGRGTYKLIGEQKLTHSYEYLRFGNNDSAISVYLYNKSKEMRDVKHKSHIWASWEHNGIQDLKNVWRLEFKITEFNKTLRDYNTGEEIEICFSELENKYFLKNLYFALYNKYFEFKINDDSKNKSRMKKLDLLNIEHCNYIWYFENKGLDSNRSDRVFIKKIESVMSELRAVNSSFNDDLKVCQQALIKHKNLEDWAEKNKLITWDVYNAININTPQEETIKEETNNNQIIN